MVRERDSFSNMQLNEMQVKLCPSRPALSGTPSDVCSCDCLFCVGVKLPEQSIYNTENLRSV